MHAYDVISSVAKWQIGKSWAHNTKDVLIFVKFFKNSCKICKMFSAYFTHLLKRIGCVLQYKVSKKGPIMQCSIDNSLEQFRNAVGMTVTTICCVIAQIHLPD